VIDVGGNIGAEEVAFWLKVVLVSAIKVLLYLGNVLLGKAGLTKGSIVAHHFGSDTNVIKAYNYIVNKEALLEMWVKY
jgi:hypothetical protein